MGYAGAIANPLLYGGLLMNWGFNVDNALKRSTRFGVNALPASNAGSYAKRCDSAVRFHLAMSDLLGGLRGEPSSADVFELKTSGPGASLLKLTRPPVTHFHKQLERVFDRARERTDRAAEILTQVTPQFSYWSAITGLHPSKTPKTLELIYMAVVLAAHITHQAKFWLACPRPVEYSPGVQPVILTPPYDTYPMGHAAEAYAAAIVLEKLFAERPLGGDIGIQLRRLARRASDNRVIAGIHFPIDAPGGYAVAEAAAGYFLAMCGQGGSKAPSIVLDGTKLDDAGDHDPEKIDVANQDWSKKDAGVAGTITKGALTVNPTDVMKAFWDTAKTELDEVMPATPVDAQMTGESSSPAVVAKPEAE